MSTTGSSEGFQLVSLKQEEDDQSSETDQLSTEEGDPSEDPAPTQMSRQPSVTESMLYPNPYHQPYISRKYFVTRPGAIETAVNDLKGHIAKTSGETIQGFWLLTEIDHWNNEKERILLITDKTLLICKYDFIMLSCVQLQRISLSTVSCVCLGKFAFPGMSLDKGQKKPQEQLKLEKSGKQRQAAPPQADEHRCMAPAKNSRGRVTGDKEKALGSSGGARGSSLYFPAGTLGPLRCLMLRSLSTL
ncbi:tumor protein p63-regulated gene 1 protein isoform X3 [Manis pentadactyla]|uniref:tumor protein p63-regulated gene 1 protein isoform X3 n=1 Tax=Manis pentadactyla TaxID=143292 RepID=UPI00255CAAC9|nr:tumor protein p63-regulated gene 1 protein isoform X3 [Manis pentadactyla]XP_057357065.1 tumor protein p63-regulated gene 1 protein isoform X3 [Manis pentadactyla]